METEVLSESDMVGDGGSEGPVGGLHSNDAAIHVANRLVEYVHVYYHACA